MSKKKVMFNEEDTQTPTEEEITSNEALNLDEAELLEEVEKIEAEMSEEEIEAATEEDRLISDLLIEHHYNFENFNGH